MSRIYFDNAASTPIDPDVLSLLQSTMSEHWGNPSSTHTEGRRAKALIEKARKSIAEKLNTSPSEIYFTSGGTESNNTAIKGAVLHLGIKRIISSQMEHHCVLHSLDHVRDNNDIEIIYLKNNELGHIDLDELEALLSESDQKTLVSLMHANNEIGTVHDIKSIGEICKKYGAYFHSDTVQSVGHLPIDLSKTEVHFISGAAHKIHGPKGVGILYIRHDVLMKAFIDGGAQEKNIRGGTENLAGIVAMARCLEIAIDQMEIRKKHILDLRNYLRQKLIETLVDIDFNGDLSDDSLYTVLNVAFPPHGKNEMILMNLDIHGIAASGGSACTSGAEKGSSVIQSLQKNPDSKAVRFSFSHLNTKAEIEKLVEVLEKIYKPVEAIV